MSITDLDDGHGINVVQCGTMWYDNGMKFEWDPKNI